MAPYRDPPGFFSSLLGRFLEALAVCFVGFVGVTDLHAQNRPDSGGLRGRVFEVGAVVGPASFGGESGLESCRWNGARFGHRFDPISGSERIQLGFRLGIEGCITDHREAGRVDLIHANAGVLFGYRASNQWLLYWFSGVGELLGDSTPGPGDDVEPRFAWHGGPGVTWGFSKRFLLDISLMGMVFENYKLGSNEPGSVFGFVPNIMLALQI